MSIIGSIDNLFFGALLLLGAVVAIFAVIERTTDSLPTSTGSWDPRSLADPEDSDKAHPGEQVVGIVCLVLALVVFNLFPDKVGAFVHMDEQSGWIPLLNQAFWQQLWLLNVCLGLDLVLHVLVLRQGEWGLALRWVRVAVSVLFVVWLSRLVYGPNIFEFDVQWMINHGWSEAAAQEIGNILHKTVLPVLDILLKVGFAGAVIGLGIRVFNTVRGSFNRA
jgi:hypothetical protein